jgi:hypothetical protein
VGGADGGLYTCAGDLDILWRAIFGGRVLSADMQKLFLQSHVTINGGGSYGLGVYRFTRAFDTAYYAVGGDFGVDFFTAYFPKQKTVASAFGNTEINTYPLLDSLFSELL